MTMPPVATSPAPAPPAQALAPRKTRTDESVIDTPRSGPASIWRTVREQRNPSSLLRAAWTRWLTQYVGHIFQGRDTFKTYQGGTGIFEMPDTVQLALVADWGTGTKTAYAIADLIRAWSPDISIHMGDVYYSGDQQEYQDYFLPASCWPTGTRTAKGPNDAAGSYILAGNHEMYSGGQAFFRKALPAYGQSASYFCLQNHYWRIIGLDTGYDCTTGLQYAVFKKDTTTINRNVLSWLATTVFPDTQIPARPVILLSHHQWFSAFEAGYLNLGDQLAPYLDRVLLWFWGHEHRFAGYAVHSPSTSKPVRARCIGHGGMPIELLSGDRLNRAKTTTNWQCRPVFVDNRYAQTVSGSPVGHCGFALLKFVSPANGQGAMLTVQYRDDANTLLLEESWEQTAAGCRGSIGTASKDPDFCCFLPIEDLVAP